MIESYTQLIIVELVLDPDLHAPDLAKHIQICHDMGESTEKI